MLRVLVSSVSAKVPLLREVRRALEKAVSDVEIWGGDTDQNCIGRYFVDGFWEMPKIEDLEICQLLSFCQEKRITAIIPTRDGELAFFAKHRDWLYEQGISVMVSSPEGVNSCLDKITFYEAVRRYLPEFAIPTSTEISTLNATSYVVKERYGAGSKNLLVNASCDEAVEHASLLDSPIFQPYIVGQEYSVDLYLSRSGKPKGAVARARNLVSEGESRVTTTVRNQRLEQICCRLASDLKLSGHLVVQVISDQENRFYIVECNCRFGGASTLSVAVGLDSFAWFFLECQGEDLAQDPFVRLPGELRQVRYADDLLIEVTD
jgi:carbamoyl-phosphate synthase large subunit